MVRKKLADASKTRRLSWYVGTVWGSRTSNVSMHEVNQTPSGNNSGQYLGVGNAGKVERLDARREPDAVGQRFLPVP